NDRISGFGTDPCGRPSRYKSMRDEREMIHRALLASHFVTNFHAPLRSGSGRQPFCTPQVRDLVCVAANARPNDDVVWPDKFPKIRFELRHAGDIIRIWKLG